MSAFRSLAAADPLIDGRQSETALRVRRGIGRLLRAHGFAMVAELPLASGRRADLIALGATGEVLIVEIKSSIADFRADAKWPDYRRHCDRLFFATVPEVPAEIFPEEAGLMVTDGHEAAILREAPVHPMPGATRKALLLRFAQAAARRLHDLADPGAAAFDRLL